MKTRKLVLIIADVILLAVCVVQGILSARKTTKNFELKDEPDQITVQSATASIQLFKDGEDWFIGDKRYEASKTPVENMVKAITSIKTLDKVGSASSEAQVEKYDLSDGKKIVVTASHEGKLLRTLTIGKDSSASSQGYVTIDSSNDIYLASGGLRNTFNTTVDNLRSKVVWYFEKSEMQSAEVTDASGKTWSLSKMGSGDDVKWNVSGATVEVDDSKANDWFDSLATITTQGWYDDPSAVLGDLICSGKVVHSYKTATFQIYKKLGSENEFIGTSSETPYGFEINEGTAKKFNKKVEDLAK